MIVGALSVAITWPIVWVWAVAFVLIGTQQYGLHIILHDGLHGRLWPGKRANDFLCRLLLSYALYSPFSALRRKHLTHHAHLGTELDPDRYYHVTTGKHTRWRFILFATAFGPIVTTVLKTRAF